MRLLFSHFNNYTMLKILKTILLFALSFTVHGQCENSEVVFINSKGEEIVPIQYIVVNSNKDTLHLEALYDVEFTDQVQQMGAYQIRTSLMDTLVVDSTINTRNTTRIHTEGFCTFCNIKETTIVDSIDVNGDGIKELFLFRAWECTAPYYHTIPHNSQSQNQWYGQYEVWDVHSKKRLFKLKNINESRIPVTVNVIRTVGFRCDVEIKANGSLSITNSAAERGFDSKYKDGVYYYKSKGSYERE